MSYDDQLQTLVGDTQRIQIVRTLAKKLLEARAALRTSVRHCAVGGVQQDPGMCDACNDAQKRVLDGE